MLRTRWSTCHAVITHVDINRVRPSTLAPHPFNLHADLQTFFWVLHFSALSAVIFPCDFLYSSTANHIESGHSLSCFGAFDKRSNRAKYVTLLLLLLSLPKRKWRSNIWKWGKAHTGHIRVLRLFYCCRHYFAFAFWPPLVTSRSEPNTGTAFFSPVMCSSFSLLKRVVTFIYLYLNVCSSSLHLSASITLLQQPHIGSSVTLKDCIN